MATIGSMFADLLSSYRWRRSRWPLTLAQQRYRNYLPSMSMPDTRCAHRAWFWGRSWRLRCTRIAIAVISFRWSFSCKLPSIVCCRLCSSCRQVASSTTWYPIISSEKLFNDFWLLNLTNSVPVTLWPTETPWYSDAVITSSRSCHRRRFSCRVLSAKCHRTYAGFK